MDGRVMMTRFVIVTAYCDLGKNVQDYPFDIHNCLLRFGSLNHGSDKLRLNTNRWKTYQDVPPYGIANISKWYETRRDFRSLDFTSSRGRGIASSRNFYENLR